MADHFTQWRDVPGFEGLYEVSDAGDVWSVRSGRALRPGRTTGGHVSVALGRGNSQHVHTLVLTAFVSPRPAGKVARHLNGIPSDNRLSNLEWSTYSVNGRDKKWHAGQSTFKLTPTDVRRIRERKAAGDRVMCMAVEYSVHPNTIYHLLSGKNHIDVY